MYGNRESSRGDLVQALPGEEDATRAAITWVHVCVFGKGEVV